ncbi:K88 minor fimbrial subunit FaeH [Erwinia pyrifoliae]|uniref:Fimbrial protein n=1 Tax=Erwinia pyrifoliae TaxID=79967 RepID=A0ABY5X9B6_ERWPY|nr:K88 minor fimbrial subunit FaeH [Erwinia pyrifoliae]AUX74126.1 fimbrial protein [Erwinia pyrifoliae]MCA8875527.1 fimbrial protein [Erwinia pyrifoliae]MCT2385181.1 fimbrial protein [Erwinia pyrifoliae]MCU8585595.1 fimbrial protein [Erwinia pyrifoliae]UWS29577.1 fimbrial protein [Erwinia pyrifoliae]
MSNKRYFISSLFILALFFSVLSQAEILDGGEIQFQGFVTDEAPKWTWQVASPDQSWAVDTADARYENGQLVFDLHDKGPLPFLEGHLHEVAERGGPGLTPLITFSSGGQPLLIVKGDSTRSQRFRAAVPVRDPDSDNTVGQLSFNLDQALAVSTGYQEEGVMLPAGMSLVSGESVTAVQTATLPQGVMSRLPALLLMNSGFSHGMSTASNGQVVSQSVLADGRVMDLAAAYASAVSGFELRLPAEGTPARWHAGLNVTVTVQ